MVRIRTSAVATIAIALTGSLPLSAQGQAARGINPQAPKLVVLTLKTTDKKLGPDAAEAIRSRIEGDVSYRSLYVVPKKDIDGTLDASGYSITDALSPADANLLAKNVRGDEYIQGAVERTATGFAITAELVLVRDMAMVQPLGRFEDVKLDKAADKVSRAYQDAQKVFDNEKKCRQLDREQKYDAALSEVKSGLTAYPRSTWLRYCQMAVLKDQKKPEAEQLAVIDEIIKIDPKSKLALTSAIGLYEKTGATDKKLAVLELLAEADPTDGEMRKNIAIEYAKAGKFDKALPLVEKAVAENPGNIELVKTYFAILGAVKNTKKMSEVGEEMIKIDTATADQDFFDKMIGAYAADSNFAKAAEMAARGTAKFAKNADLWLVRSQLERKLGQAAPALTSLRRAIAIDPKKVDNAHANIARGYNELNITDSALVEVRESVKAGEDKLASAGVAVQIGDNLRKQADAAKTPEAWGKAYAALAYADSIAVPQTKPQAKFLLGLSAFQLAAPMLQEAQTGKSCDLAKKANDYLVTAQINLPAGGSFSAAATTQLMGYVTQYLPASEQMKKQYCK
jgi:tetratricopeptide (TPR) repeat protein